MNIEVKVYPFGTYDENTYLVTDKKSGFKAIIDPGFYSKDVKNDIGDPSSLKHILLTHGHSDHYDAASDYIREFPDAIFSAPQNEETIMEDCPKPDQLLKDSDIIKLGESEFKVISTPGHTAGGICFLIDEVLFSGDTLFRLSVGRTDLPSGDWNTLVKSIKTKLYTLSDEITVFPGHGEPTSIGYEKRSNPFV